MATATADIFERRNRVLAEAAPLFYKNPLVLARSSGVEVFDSNGRRYLDAYNNVPHVGHCHPRVVRAIHAQAEKLNTHTRYLNEITIRYAERLTERFHSSLSKVVFCCSGSEANEVALRLARLHTGGDGIIVSAFTYHGNTAAVLEVSNAFETGAPASARVRTIPVFDSYRDPAAGDAEALSRRYAAEVQKQIDDLHSKGVGVAGLLLCTAMASEGLPTLPAGALRRAIDVVHKAGGLFIADEVQAGFGRMGTTMWGHEVLGVVPDVVTLGKPMGNGHPIAGVVARPDLIDEFATRSAYFNTFGGNPVACAAGAAVLDVLEEEGLLQNATRVGNYLRQGLRELQAKHAIIGDVRGSGLFIGVELVEDRASRKPAKAATVRTVNEMRERGVLISKTGPADNVLKIRPPMPFSRANADEVVARLDDVLADL